MTHSLLSLFSGIGGLDLAAHWAGFETAAFVEREPFCQQVLAKYWPGVPIYDDAFDYHPNRHFDAVCGGFPCQPFSVAGNRKGADDERYLLPEMLRIIREVQPYAVLFENVPGFPSLNDGAEFKYLLRTLAEMGFDAEWGHLRASDCGAPHQRERWFCVAYTTGIRQQRHSKGQGQDRLQQGRASELTRGNKTLADTECPRGQSREVHITDLYEAPGGRAADTPIASRTACDSNGVGLADAESAGRQPLTSSLPAEIRKQENIIIASAGKNNGRGVGNPSSARLERPDRYQPAFRKRTRPGRGSTEPRLCRTADGLPGWLDFPGWPARPGENQHAYEPSRVTQIKTPDRAARLKALGNAVVPQVVYPLFIAINEWLNEIKEAQE